MHYVPNNRGEVLRQANIQKPLAFCRPHLFDLVRSWAFTDAKLLHVGFELLGKATHCWQEIGKPPSPGPITNPFTFQFYAVVAYGHKSCLVFVPPSLAEGSSDHKSEERFNSKHYISMMEQLGPRVKDGFQGGSFHVIQNNAKQHPSHTSKKAVGGMGLLMLFHFPPQTWDLNIIENVWGVLVEKLRGVKAKTSSAWHAAIIKAWERVEQSTIDNLVDGMPARMQQVIDAENNWVPNH
jgi:hypothetical protein